MAQGDIFKEYEMLTPEQRSQLEQVRREIYWIERELSGKRKRSRLKRVKSGGLEMKIAKLEQELCYLRIAQARLEDLVENPEKEGLPTALYT